MDDKRDRLTDDELAYHQFLLAQQAESHAQVQAVQAAIESWSAHLARRYGLADGDGVTRDGRIVAKVTVPAEGP